MQLERARILNFRSIKDLTVEFGAHTALIGGNGAGKSSILKALERFFATTKTLDADDFHGRDQAAPVEIELTFSNLTDAEAGVFQSRVRDGRLVVTRIFDGSPSSGRYCGMVPQNRDFSDIRSQSQATLKRQAYTKLRDDNPRYAALPVVGSAAAVDQALERWEAENPSELTLERDNGQFFGFQNAGRGALQRYISFVFVPAVRDAADDAADSKNSPIGRLMEILVRSAILRRAEMQAFQNEITTRYANLVHPDNLPELDQLAGNLTRDLKEIYGDASVGMTWRSAVDIPLPLPAAEVLLTHDGFGGPVDRQGHGLQRAFIFTLLQHLARASAPAPVDSAADHSDSEFAFPIVPNLILAVEEPELYQHPTKQRHFATVLRRLSTRLLPGATGATQVIFASHSPMFVSLGHADEIRLIRRVPCTNSPFKQCEALALDLSVIAKKLGQMHSKPEGTFTAQSLKPRLHILGTELSEGFFAAGVVLVEGRSDKAALMAAAKFQGVNFEADGIAVLSAEGKHSLDRPYLIFRELGIPTYVIWDCDVGNKKKHSPSTNLALNKMVYPDETIVEPEQETVVRAEFAAFNVSLEHTIKEALTSEIFDDCLRQACHPYGIDPGGDTLKIPDVMHDLLRLAESRGRTCTILADMVRAITKLVNGKATEADVPPLQSPARVA